MFGWIRLFGAAGSIRLPGRIKSFETVTLHVSGMLHVTDYEIVMSGGEAEVSQYSVGYRDGKAVRQLPKRAVCSAERALKLFNECRLLSWDGFHGKRPKDVKDGIIFRFEATVNGGKKICAAGSHNFPRHYHDFADGLYKILNEENSER